MSNSEMKKEVILVEIIDDLGRRTQIRLNDTQLSMEKVVSFVIAEPITFARFIYNAENYIKLSKCFNQKAIHTNTEQCSSTISVELYKNAMLDLCWALLDDKIEATDSGQASKWRELFDNLKNDVGGVCGCCMQRREATKASCRWTWRDKCSKITILNNK